MANLVETILSSLPANTVDALGGALGESPDNTLKGLAGVLPLVLSSFAQRAASGGDIGGLVAQISNALTGGNPLDNPVGLLGQTSTAGIGNLATTVLGPKLGLIAPAVASYFGLKGSSVTSLLSLAGPLIAGGIGKVLGASPSVESVRNLLISEKDSYETALPAEVRRLVAAPAAAAYERPGSVTAAAMEAEEASGAWKWWLLGLALLGLLGWLFFGRGDPQPRPVAATTATGAPAVSIPAGAGVLSEERNGKPVLVVFFDTGKSDVTNDLSAEALAIKTYVDSNPGTRVSVSGFNDPTGNAAANEALSKNRAEAVKAALVEAGFEASRIDLDKPAAATDTSETFAGARRVEVTIKG